MFTLLFAPFTITCLPYITVLIVVKILTNCTIFVNLRYKLVILVITDNRVLHIDNSQEGASVDWKKIDEYDSINDGNITDGVKWRVRNDYPDGKVMKAAAAMIKNTRSFLWNSCMSSYC